MTVYYHERFGKITGELIEQNKRWAKIRLTKDQVVNSLLLGPVTVLEGQVLTVLRRSISDGIELSPGYEEERVMMYCPVCGTLLKGSPYKTIDPYSEHSGEEISSDGPTPEWLRALPIISGYTYNCSSCGCSVRVPITRQIQEGS